MRVKPSLEPTEYSQLQTTILTLGFEATLSWSTQSSSPPDTNVAHYPRLMYYYHPDYLGHVEYITDLDGLPPALSGAEVYQHFYYTAWGETLLDQKATRPGMQFDSPYRFNDYGGKSFDKAFDEHSARSAELDEETGLYYYGARYYTCPERHCRFGNPKVSVWLGVDPKAYAFPHVTSYNFLLNNPIMMVDPGGDSTTFASNADKKFVEALVDPSSDKYDKNFADKYQKLVESKETFHFISGSYEEEMLIGWTGPDPESGDINVFFTMDGPYTRSSGIGHSEYSALYEETYHAWDYATGGLDFDSPTILNEANAWKFAATAPGTKHLTLDQNGKVVQTVMQRILDSNLKQVAIWLKYGMPPTLFSVGFEHKNGGGIYGENGGDLPLGF